MNFLQYTTSYQQQKQAGKPYSQQKINEHLSSVSLCHQHCLSYFAAGRYVAVEQTRMLLCVMLEKFESCVNNFYYVHTQLSPELK